MDSKTAVPAFRMTTPARATTVAKQLKKILAEMDRPTVLGHCRETVARMYGYADWRDLNRSIGGEASPDDAGVGPAERQERHAHQRSVLEALGLKPQAAENLRIRLSPTGRTEADVIRGKPVEIDQTVQYHPERFLDAVEQVARLKFEMSLYAQGNRPGSLPRDFVADNCPNYRLDILLEDVREWARRSKVLPLDTFGLEASRFSGLYGLASAVREAEGRLIDATCVARRLAAEDAAGATYSGEWGPMVTTYVHLGTNALPSPWPDCGIEGCYVRTAEAGVHVDARSMALTFVASPETSDDPDLGIGEEFTDHPNDGLVFGLRHISTVAVGGDDDVIAVRDLADGIVMARPEEAEAWRPFLPAAVNAVWNALKAAREGRLPLKDGVISDVPEELFARLVRARTPDQRRSAVEAIAEQGEIVVEFLGGVARDAVAPGETRTQRVDAPFPAVSKPADWGLGYIRMAEEAAYPSVQLQMARRASAIIPQAEGSMDEYVKTRALVLEENALSDMGRWEEAKTAALRCLDYDEHDGNGMRFRLASLLVLTDDVEGAKALLARYDREDAASLTTDWSRTLLLARFGTQEESRRALAQALRNPASASVRARLLSDERHREAWHDYDMVTQAHHDGNGEAYMVAGMHRDGWKAIPNWRELLQRIDPDLSLH